MDKRQKNVYIWIHLYTYICIRKNNAMSKELTYVVIRLNNNQV